MQIMTCTLYDDSAEHAENGSHAWRVQRIQGCDLGLRVEG